ncbi:hypothetical protein AVEN_262885-1 [Araneus ventricosus]|uniref:Integrase catalytic domain-containing protein n=1 Tax=Araneus ventricosus TaxID=182803 RepID=A0A4Y2DFZ0_ARAVE|nr:hypothetical protein AVEN_262885-1 [Araneus ventricosus]
MVDQAATTIAQAFLQEWVYRFSVPEIITTYRGTNFQSHFFHNLANLLGSYKNRSSVYNPKANGMIKRVHRQIKAALMAHSTADWVGALPLVLLGIRSSINPLSGSVFFLKRFETRAAAEPLSVLKVSSSQQKIFPKALQIKSLPPSKLWTIINNLGEAG